MKANPFPSPISTDGTQILASSCSEKNHTDVFSGNLLETYTVVSVPTVGLPLRLQLVYNSQETVLG